MAPKKVEARTHDATSETPFEVPSPRRIQHAALHLPALRPLQEINERCLELLVQAARKDSPGTLSLVIHLRDLLRALTPETRSRASQRALLLVDMQFANLEWWQAVRDHPARVAALSTGRGAFPRPHGLQLARSTLTLAWHSVHSDPYSACLLGMTPAVSQIIGSLSLTEIDRVVERGVRHVRPRWDDRPGVWRRLLLAAQSENMHLMREFNLYSLQLLTGELLEPPT